MKIVVLALGVALVPACASAVADSTPSRGAAAARVADAKKIPLGTNGPFAGVRLLADSSAWNQRIDQSPVDPASAVMIAGIGNDAPLHPDFGTTYRGAPWGIPYVVVPGTTPMQKLLVDYGEESDGYFYPIPADVQSFNIEGHVPGDIPEGERDDQHLLIVDRDHAKLYELFALHRNGAQWHATSGAVFDLLGDTRRTPGWTSADAAGLPILPGLVRFDEVQAGKIDHALRFTTKRSRKAYVAPASHWASNNADPSLPPMGARLRLKASINPNDFPSQARPIIVALQKYGMFLADNGGSLFLSGAPNPGWHEDEIEALKRLHARDFEVVKLGAVTNP